MNALQKNRRLLFAITASAIILLTALAAGLSEIKFAPAQPLNLGGGEVRPVAEALAKIANAFSETPFWQQVALVGIFFIVIVLAIVFMSSELRKRLLRTTFRAAIFALAILYFFNNYQMDAASQIIDNEVFSMTTMEDGELSIAEPQIFEPQEVSPVWSYLVSLIILAIFGISAWWLWRKWAANQPSENTPLKEFSRIAQASLDELDDGANWEDVIIRSYVQMGAVVKERRGIERAEEMTPHEFAVRLVDAGLPPSPVEQLTRLFEFVRYSQHSAGQEQIEEAVTCLNEIADAFGEKLR